jgi:hypothetical protein
MQYNEKSKQKRSIQVKEGVEDKKDASIGSRTRVHRLGSGDDNRYTIDAFSTTTTTTMPSRPTPLHLNQSKRKLYTIPSRSRNVNSPSKMRRITETPLSFAHTAIIFLFSFSKAAHPHAPLFLKIREHRKEIRKFPKKFYPSKPPYQQRLEPLLFFSTVIHYIYSKSLHNFGCTWGGLFSIFYLL